MDLGPHALTILACYAAVAVVIGGVAAWLVAEGRRLEGEIERLEMLGIRRRSAGDASPGGSASEPEPGTRS